MLHLWEQMYDALRLARDWTSFCSAF